MRNKPRVLPIWAAGVALAAAISLSAQTSAGAKPHANPPATTGELTGIVTDASGYPEAGAVAQIRPADRRSAGWQRVTSDRGIFSLSLLPPGVYLVDIGKGSRIAPRRRIEVRASERALLLVSLPELASAIQFGGGPAATAAQAQQLRWALRQPPAWRPVFRLLDPSDPGDPIDSSLTSGAAVDGYVSLSAGGDTRAFSGNGDFATAFQIDTALWGQSRMALNGNLSTSGPYPDSQLQATFRPSADPNSQSVLMVGMRSLPTPALGGLGSLQVVTLNWADGVDVGDRLHLQYGALLTTVSSSSSLHTFDPYFRGAYRVGAHGLLQYRFAAAVPPLQFDSDMVSMVDPTPHMSLDNDRVQVERARHQELQFAEDLSSNDSVSAAVFSDRYEHAAINGGLADPQQMSSGDVLPDLLSNMFTADGGAYGGSGYRIVYQRRLGDSLDAAVSYTSGAVLVPGAPRVLTTWADALRSSQASAWTAKIDGTVPRVHTHIVCSYRALNRLAVTGLDLYDDGAAQSDSYANVAVHQPLPDIMGPGNRLEALVQVDNLLAQGYVPMVGSDGHTLYFIQSARTVRGGFSINF